MFRNRDDFLSPAFVAVELGYPIDSTNEHIIAEYDDPNGISALHCMICYFGSVVLFSLDPK